MKEFILQRSFDFTGEAADILQLFVDKPFVFLLESSLHHPSRGRYSFIGFDPFDVFKNSGRHPLSDLKKKFFQYAPPAEEKRSKSRGMSPFPSGMMGYLGYEVGLSLEDIKKKAYEDSSSRSQCKESRCRGKGISTVPDCVFGFYDSIITIDHFDRKLTITSSGLPEKQGVLRKKRARERLDRIARKLSFHFSENNIINHNEVRPTVMRDMGKDVPSFLESNFTRKEYLKTVKKALAYIRQGEIYQVNLSQRFCFNGGSGPRRVTPLQIYRWLGELSPACFGGYFDCGDFQIISSSPERFLNLQGRHVQTRPMKGTRPRGRNTAEDAKRKSELLKSKKDKAELLMITDLGRNDLGRVCQHGTVNVKEMRTLEKYKTVFQSTSMIEGKLRDDKDCFDLIEACFPGGSITGCPKIRAMQIIDELEPTPRSIYTGSLGYINFAQDMDMNILIRTLLIQKEKISFHVGGGIVADSTPENEYEETIVKARAMQDCLRLAAVRGSV